MPDFIKEIVTDPVRLKRVCKPIAKLIDSAVLDDICVSLIDTYQANATKCVGLAANQLGFGSRVILVRLRRTFVLMINPVVTPSLMHGRTTKKEACLSFPGKTARVKRYKRISVEYNPYSKKSVARLTHTFTGIEARIIQHEVDHLNGKCIIG